jgi:hypothetical protein
VKLVVIYEEESKVIIRTNLYPLEKERRENNVEERQMKS